MRLFQFLESARAVWNGSGCLTEEGCKYLGVPFRFPAPDPWESSIKVSEITILKQRISATLQAES